MRLLTLLLTLLLFCLAGDFYFRISKYRTNSYFLF